MNNSKRKYALISGISLLLMAVAAAYSYGYVYHTLVIQDDDSTTLFNLSNNSVWFGSSLWGWLIIFITDLLVAWSLYKYFAPINQKISMVTGLIRLVYSAFLAFAIAHLLSVWNALNDNLQDESRIIDLLNLFEDYWSSGLILFGFHLMGLAYLCMKSNTVPRWIVWLLYIAGISYAAIHAAKAITSDPTDTIAIAETIMSIPMAIAELALAVWLLLKGGKSNLAR